ncbi:MAG: hemin uptake protein HemP [Planctomycetota bacterium]
MNSRLHQSSEQGSPDEANSPEGPAVVEPSAARFAPKIVRFEDLARCGDEIWIEHNNNLYRLRRTRQGKLILTK